MTIYSIIKKAQKENVLVLGIFAFVREYSQYIAIWITIGVISALWWIDLMKNAGEKTKELYLPAIVYMILAPVGLITAFYFWWHQDDED